MIEKTTLKIIKEIDEYFAFLESKISIKEPINIKEEKVKFFNLGTKYNPQFRYPTYENIPIEQNVKELIYRIEPDEYRELYLNKFDEYKNKIELIKLVGTNIEEFTDKSISLYGELSEESIEVAKKIVEIMPPRNFGRKHKDNFRFKRIVKELKKYLKKNKLNGRVNIRHGKHTGNNVSISKVNGKVNISNNYIADQDEVIDIIYHELETHMRRYENGKKQISHIFVTGTAGYLKTEEGLAAITGHLFKKNKIMWHPAILILAMNQALSGDFCSVYKLINRIIKNPFQSWSYAVRVKDGIANTSKPGALTKDLYLQWVIEVGRELIQSPKLLKTAYNGKATLEELMKYTKRTIYKPKITIEQIKNLLKVNFIK